MLIYRFFKINKCQLEHFAPIFDVDEMAQKVWLNKVDATSVQYVLVT